MCIITITKIRVATVGGIIRLTFTLADYTNILDTPLIIWYFQDILKPLTTCVITSLTRAPISSFFFLFLLFPDFQRLPIRGTGHCAHVSVHLPWPTSLLRLYVSYSKIPAMLGEWATFITGRSARFTCPGYILHTYVYQPLGT